MSLFLFNRSPEAGETGIPIDEEIFLEVVDTSGHGINLAATKVYLTSEGGSEILAFDAGTFQLGFAGPNSAYSSFATGVLRIRIDLASTFNSEELFTVRVESANDAALPELINTSYSFTVEDVTAPKVVSAEAQDLRVVRVTFDEAMTQVSLGNVGDSLNPANYTFARLTAPSVNVAAVSVVAVASNIVDVTTDIDLSPSKLYRVTVLDAEDSKGNPVQAPFNYAEFAAFTLPVDEAREFDLYRLLPLINRLEDRSQDLMKFMAVCQEPLDLLLRDIDQWPTRLLDPDTADAQYVDVMLCDLGNPFSFAAGLGLVDRRRLIRVLLDIYKLKGTEVGIIQVVLFFLGLTITIDEYNAEDGWILGESELGEGIDDGECILGPSASFLRYSFTVGSAITLTDTQKSLITDLVIYMKPAHTHFLGFVEPAAPVTIDHLELGLSELGVTWELH